MRSPRAPQRTLELYTKPFIATAVSTKIECPKGLRELISLRVDHHFASVRSFLRLCVGVLFVSLPVSLVGQGGPLASSSLRGIVRDAQGQPVPFATVRLGGVVRLVVSADPTGHYSFAILGAGSYQVTAESPTTHAKREFSVTIARDEAKTLDLTLGSPSDTSTPVSDSPSFYDEPKFTVSGVTDTTNLGGHGSDTIVHARDSLAKQAVSLRKDGNNEPQVPTQAAENELRARLEKETANADLHHQLADLEERLGQSLDAVREYQRAAELNPTESYFFDWGSELLLHHAPEPAAQVFGKGDRLFPKSERMLIGWGAALFARGSDEEAVQKFCAASDLNPSESMPYVFLGRLLSSLIILPDELVEHLHRFYNLHPDNAYANYYYAVGLWRQPTMWGRDIGEIEALLEKAVRLDPQFAAAYLELGIVQFATEYGSLPDYREAISDYQKAIEADPKMAEAHYRLAQIYRVLGQKAEAKAEIDIYQRLATQSALETHTERHQIQQFVYTLRDQNPPAKP